MKELKEIRLEDLTLEQKLGFVTTALAVWNGENLDQILEMIDERTVGSVFVALTNPKRDEILRAIRERADYPIIIMCDAEGGVAPYEIGRHNSIGCADSEELAYIFGKVTAVSARKLGYNMVCVPVLDMCDANFACGANTRSLGSDKYRVTELAAPISRALHDVGILSLAKHYPGYSSADPRIDSHMGEGIAEGSEADLLDYDLYPYIELNRQGLIDGVMTNHFLFPKIDEKYPASLSAKVMGLFRERGFDGIMLTDALTMMGVVAKFGDDDSLGLAVGNGNDLALAWRRDHRSALRAMVDCYHRGMISDERLDEAVRRVLEAQHKTLRTPLCTEVTEEELEKFDRLNSDSIFERVDEGVPPTVSRDGNHCFAIMTAGEEEDPHALEIDPMDKNWYRVGILAEKIKTLFPNSKILTIPEFPSADKTNRFLSDSLDSEDVIFITFFNSQAYIGMERLTARILSIMYAMQRSGRISTVVHFGNPYVLEDVPHIPRVLIAQPARQSLEYALDVLAGNYPAKGKLTYDVKFQ